MNLLGIIALVVAFLAGGILLLFGRNLRRAGLLLISIAVCTIIFFAWRSYRYKSIYSQIEIGASQTLARSLLGKPSQITDCTTTYGGHRRSEFERMPLGCAEEYWYYSFFTPEAWSFSFDREKKLIYKYHWVSP
jgi:hypothetical protein